MKPKHGNSTVNQPKPQALGLHQAIVGLVLEIGWALRHEIACSYSIRCDRDGGMNRDSSIR